MRFTLMLIFLLIAMVGCVKPPTTSYVITDDIPRFWEAYDQIVATQDSLLQLEILTEVFINPGTPGLKAFMDRKGYTPELYLEAIRNYPEFWNSIRPNTLKAKGKAAAIEAEVAKFQTLYPDWKNARIYFTIGALYSNGTTADSMVLIGSELAMADSTIQTQELPGRLGENLSRFFATNPIEDVVLLNVHEYVHTQQNTYGYDLLSQSLYEGVAEFVSVTASGKPSAAPAIDFGRQHDTAIRDRFVKEMFSPNWDDWLYNNFDNEFQMRDLGYYLGYAICENYYNAAEDKKAAIKRMIEVDFGDSSSVETFVEETRFFDTPLADLKLEYEKMRPAINEVLPFGNGSQSVDPTLDEITITFTQPMSDRFGRFAPGALGPDHALPIRGYLGMGEDNKSFRYRVALEPGKEYSGVMTEVFRGAAGHALVPDTVSFKTSN